MKNIVEGEPVEFDESEAEADLLEEKKESPISEERDEGESNDKPAKNKWNRLAQLCKNDFDSLGDRAYSGDDKHIFWWNDSVEIHYTHNSFVEYPPISGRLIQHMGLKRWEEEYGVGTIIFNGLPAKDVIAEIEERCGPEVWKTDLKKKVGLEGYELDRKFPLDKLKNYFPDLATLSAFNGAKMATTKNPYLAVLAMEGDYRELTLDALIANKARRPNKTSVNIPRVLGIKEWMTFMKEQGRVKETGAIYEAYMEATYGID